MHLTVGGFVTCMIGFGYSSWFARRRRCCKAYTSGQKLASSSPGSTLGCTTQIPQPPRDSAWCVSPVSWALRGWVFHSYAHPWLTHVDERLQPPGAAARTGGSRAIRRPKPRKAAGPAPAPQYERPWRSEESAAAAYSEAAGNSASEVNVQTTHVILLRCKRCNLHGELRLTCFAEAAYDQPEPRATASWRTRLM